MKPEDVPADMVTAFKRAELLAALDETDPVRAVLARFLPEARKLVFAELFGTPEEIAAREAEAAKRKPDMAAELCERFAPGEHEQQVRAKVAAEIAEPSVWADPFGGWSADQWDAARAMKDHIIRCIARGGA